MPTYYLAIAPEQKRLQQEALSVLLADAEIAVIWRHTCGYFALNVVASEHLYDQDDVLTLVQERYERCLGQFLARIPDDHALRHALGRYLHEYLEAEIDRVTGYPSVGLFGGRFEQFLGNEAVQCAAYEKAINAATTRKPGPDPGKLTPKERAWLEKIPTLRERAMADGKKFGYAYVKQSRQIKISRSGFQYMRKRFPNI